MTDDLSWMVKGIVDNVPGARHAVVLSADGISKGATDGLTSGGIKDIAAAMASMQSLSKATARFAGPVMDWRWNQTLVEFEDGWILVTEAGRGAYLAAAAAPDVDLQAISFRMQRLVARLGDHLTSAPRVNGAAVAVDAKLVEDETAGGRGSVLPELDKAVAGVQGARHAVLLGTDGLLRGTTSGIGKDMADVISAAMSGMVAYSRATAPFAGGLYATWRQTLVEFEHGWVFLIPAGPEAYLAASAEHHCDIEEFLSRLEDVVPALNAASAPQTGTVGYA
ncbi:roadblock/LC7 domain-containing protein [Streptomyces pseudovenezuelae]|uniref:Roadblock/LC7 domain-containing protein n=2 Tax=Streptomyces pseudovenezuelae TaxID=67350 RepID=A0ABZ1X7P4_9ACTN|nr:MULTISPECIES: roadblock/LC7 domain-containing protein [Streptomyces]WUA86471.1 roadblock/LC7 domain-containing protein [Streptomyces pseudovenezuelae]